MTKQERECKSWDLYSPVKCSNPLGLMFWIVPKVQEKAEAKRSGSGILYSGLTTS